VVDIVAKTTEGIDNQAKDKRDLAINKTRIRNPRPFYEMDLLIRPYEHFHANWMYIIPHITKIFDLKNFYDAFCISERVDRIQIKKIDIR